MRCAVFRDQNQAIAIEERAVPKPGPGEVVVSIKAAALNHRDLWITKGLYPGVTPPVVLGSDGAGIIGALGDGVSNWQVGDEVLINPGINWGSSERHQAADFEILGSPKDGTIASHLVIAAEQLVSKPPHLSWPEAAALPLAGLTAWRALHSRGGVTPAMTVLVSGIGGGVSLFALQFAVAMGCTVLVTSSSAEKRQRALDLGATAAFDYHDDTWSKTLKKAHGGVDLVIDGAAGSGFNHFLACAKAGARIVCYGGTAGLPADLNVRQLFWKQIDICGSTMGSPADFEAMVKAVDKHQIQSVVDSTLPLSDISTALNRMDAGAQFGKLVLDCG